MRLTRIAPPPEVAPWVHQMWVFESQTGLPAQDLRIVVPNGRGKLIVPWRNGLSADGAGVANRTPEGQPVLIGQWEAPTVISSTPEPTVTIGVEFRPNGLARFFPAPAREVSGQIAPLDAVMGPIGARLARRVAEAETLAAAVGLVRGFLVSAFRSCGAGRQQTPVDAALGLMAASAWAMDLATLERRMGYTRRHLTALFQRDIGLPPARLAAILGFEALYRDFSRHGDAALLREAALDRFHDHPHFIRTFRRFTGHAPGRFVAGGNDFGQVFYRD